MNTTTIRTFRRLVGVVLSMQSALLFASPPPVMMGVNLSAAGFGTAMPGTYGTDYIYPDASYLDYYKSRGIELIRFPFKWERIQHTLYGDLDTAELARLDAFLDAVGQRGMLVILDLHNYGRYRLSGTDYIIGSPEVPRSAFRDVWEKLAAHVKDRDCIWAYGIMNEPHDMGSYTWKDSAQVAVDGIRQYDSRHAILLPGDQFSGAYRWLTAGADLIDIVDPADNVIFEAHQYFDYNSSGLYTKTYDEDGATADIGVQRLTDFVNWCHANGVRGFIGEYGVPDDDPRWLTILDNTLAYLAANNISGAYWAGGPWWGDYPLSSEMRQLAREAPQMPFLISHGNGVGTRYWPPYVWYKDSIAPSPEGTYPYLNKSGTATVVADFYDTDSATGVYSQARSIRIAGAIPPGGSANGGLQIKGGVNVTPNVERGHVLSFYIKGTPGSSIRVFLRDVNQTIGNKIDSANYVSTDGEWRQVRIPLDALLNGTSVDTSLLDRISFDLLPADGADRVWQLDQFAIERPESVAPVVTVSSPGGTTFDAGASFTATATATDADSGIDYVQFLLNGEPVAIDETSPYSVILSLPEPGDYRLTAIAFDMHGNPALSTPVPLTARSFTEYQAESATALSDVVIKADSIAGYTGTGYLDYGGNASYAEWNNIHVPAAGTYTLSIRYALGNTSRPCDVTVNGVSTGNVTFTPTGNWSTWAVVEKTISLNAGDNIIRITAVTADGGPNIDRLNLIPHEYQAEDAPVMSGVVAASNHAGYTGTGFADFGGIGTYIEWNTIYAPVAGSYVLTFRYALGNSSRPCDIIVNGVAAGSAAFAPTGSWTTWMTENKTVTLKAGNNTLRLTASTSSGGPNVDLMTRN